MTKKYYEIEVCSDGNFPGQFCDFLKEASAAQNFNNVLEWQQRELWRGSREK